MIVRANWKTWSVPLCLAASLTATQVHGQELLPANDTLAAPEVVDSYDGELSPAAAVGSISDDEEDAPVPAPLGLAGEEEELAPAPTTVEPAPAKADSSEVIEERYPDGSLKVAREVIQDAAGNYMNHGAWKMFNQRGALVAEGQFYEDKRHGVWNRWYQAGEIPLLKTKPFSDFQAPFISQGIFDSGDLHGAWLFYDAKHRKICEIRFTHGERDGVATWYHPNGRKMREIKYDKGVVDGLVQEWAPDGTLVLSDKYDKGRRHMTQTVHYGGDAKKFTGQFLEPELQAKTLDDWWNGRMAVYTSSGKPIKHGSYTSWHPNGQLRMRGEYKYDMPIGTFSWWYPNGQKSLEGTYEEGKQEGEWNWWHENGQPSIRGYFTAGNPSGKWTWWNKEGKVAQSGDFSDEKGSIVVAPVTPAPTTAVPTPAPQQAVRPRPANSSRR